MRTEFSISVKLSDDGTLNDESFSDSEAPTAAIIVPQILFGGDRNISRVGTVVFVNGALFQQTSRSVEVRSVVLTLDVFNNGDKVLVNNLASPIILTFATTVNQPICVFWDDSTSKCITVGNIALYNDIINTESWSTVGCTTASVNRGQVNCECNHLSSFTIVTV